VFWTELNLSIFKAVNGLCGRYLALDELIGQLEDTGLKGIVIMATFGMLWFARAEDQEKRREHLIVTILELTLTILVIRIVEFFSEFQIRPMYTTNIGYQAPLVFIGAYGFEGWNSFPSDTAGMLFALATGFWFASRLWGGLFGIFSICAVIARIYLGIHYPVDILVGALIGIGVTIVSNAKRVRPFISSWFLAVERRVPGIFYSLLLVILYEVGTVFYAVRGMWHTAFNLLFANVT
jgi:undecaprenyl-diphosphatase